MTRLVPLLLALLVAPARGHEWYEQSCCGGQDCAPVADGVVENVKDGVQVAGWGVLSYTDPRLRWSQDGHDHLCVSKGYQAKLLCVYRKPQWF